MLIKLTEIRENPIALRSVNIETEQFHGLIDSIKAMGILNPIVIRQKADPSGKKYYELVDGLQRFTAARYAGLTEIPVHVKDLDDDMMMEAQIIGNIHKIETKAHEYTKQLIRILARNPLMTEAELAGKLLKSNQWIRGRLGLSKIANPEIIRQVNDGTINLTNAVALASLPPDEMPDWIERAVSESPEIFVAEAAKRVKEIKEARRKGNDPAAIEFSPIAHGQKVRVVKEELESGTVGKMLIDHCQPDGLAAAFKLGISWTLHMDPISVEKQRVDWDARQKAKAERKAKQAEERATKKAEKERLDAANAADAASAAQAAMA